MAQSAFEEIVEDFEFLEDWEERYRYVIDRGKAMDVLDDALKVPATKVDGCASQVWLHPRVEAGQFSFEGASDAMIVVSEMGEQWSPNTPPPITAAIASGTGIPAPTARGTATGIRMA